MTANPILRAARFAAEQHADQRRKGLRREPYINHLLEVAELVSSTLTTPDQNLVIAALLHDIVEDTPIGLTELAERFGDDVASLVAEMTDDKALPQAERKRLQIVNAPHKSPRAQVIKLADKISNLRSMLGSPPAEWDAARIRDYFDWAVKVVAALPQPNQQLLREFHRIVQQFDETSK